MFMHSSVQAKQAAKKPVEVVVNNRTTVLVWLPKSKGQPTSVLKVFGQAIYNQSDAGLSVGHVAMVTPQKYVSLHPGESIEGNMFKVVSADYRTYKQDLDSEGGEPDTMVTLYSLDTTAMANEFDNIRVRNGKYVLVGDASGISSSREHEAYNCNELIHKLLQIGDVNKVIPVAAGSTFPLYISPDKFDAYIKQVKAEELKKHPQTATFEKVVGEYQPDASNKPTLASKLGL